MDLISHLEAFVAAADHTNITRAAEALNIPQPLLSRRIKHLEHHWGGPLLTRSPRGVAPTELAETLLPSARELVARAGRLAQLARVAQSTRGVGLGLPPDCGPRGLAQIIGAAAERGIPLVLRELLPEARADGLKRHELAMALLRVTPASAPLRVRMGMATVGPPTDARPAHLDSLRPRHTVRSQGPPALLILPEDDIGLFLNRLRRAAAAAGLAEENLHVRAAAPAAAEVMTGPAVLLCDLRLARRLGLAWAPLADRTLDRGYELSGADHARPGHEGAEWLISLLRMALGAELTDAADPAADAEASDVVWRLAAMG